MTATEVIMRWAQREINKAANSPAPSCSAHAKVRDREQMARLREALRRNELRSEARARGVTMPELHRANKAAMVNGRKALMAAYKVGRCFHK